MVELHQHNGGFICNLAYLATSFNVKTHLKNIGEEVTITELNKKWWSGLENDLINITFEIFKF